MTSKGQWILQRASGMVVVENIAHEADITTQPVAQTRKARQVPDERIMCLMFRKVSQKGRETGPSISIRDTQSLLCNLVDDSATLSEAKAPGPQTISNKLYPQSVHTPDAILTQCVPIIIQSHP